MVPTYDDFLPDDISGKPKSSLVDRNLTYFNYLIQHYSSKPKCMYRILTENFDSQMLGGSNRSFEHNIFTQKGWWDLSEDIIVFSRSNDSNRKQLFSMNKEFTRQASGTYRSRNRLNLEVLISNISELFPKIPVVDFEYIVVKKKWIRAFSISISTILEQKKIRLCHTIRQNSY